MKTARPSFSGPDGQEDMPYLLTPGPVTTSQAVKLAMLADFGPRDPEFIAITADIRARLLAAAACGPEFECVLLEGPGTYAIEAMLGSFAPDRRRKTLVVANGDQGRQVAAILERMGRPHVMIDKGDGVAPTVEDLGTMLDSDKLISHVWLVHCETSSGIVNPLRELAGAAKARGKIVMADATSSFGALAINFSPDGVDAIAAAPDMCLEGVPGVSFVIARRTMIEAAAGKSHSVALDLEAQWRALGSNGHFRFTPPTHTLVAFLEALRAFEAEGGLAARYARYQKNAIALAAGMKALGFVPLIDGAPGPIIQAFLMPADTAFSFVHFSAALRARGFSISPGTSATPSFRIGTAGAMDERNIASMLVAVQEVAKAMRIADFAP